MIKKLSCIILALVMVFAITGCRTQTPATPAGSDASDGGTTEAVTLPGEIPADWKIGIMTGTVSQGEEEFQAAQKMIRTYGADRIITATYPDKFNDEVETTIAQVVALADQGANAIVFCQAVPGAIAAMSRVRERYPDILFIAGTAAEAPREIASIADVVFQTDDIGIGNAIAEQAQKQGAEVFVHYSFPRHLSYETIALRRQLIKENCERLGIKFFDVTAPDPTGDAGVAGAQQFIVEDLPRQIQQHGKNTAFFSTNCSMQEPLIRGIAEQGAIYPQPCCPSPYHAYPAALNISTAGHEGDVRYMLDQVTMKVAELGNTGRMSNWPLPVNMLFIEAGTDYAVRYLNGEFTDKFDIDEIKKSVNTVSGEYGGAAQVSVYSDAEGPIDNYLMVLCEYYNF